MKYLLLLIFLLSCSSVKKHPEDVFHEEDSKGSTEDHPEPGTPQNVALVLGPGFGRTAYYVGVFQAVEKCHVKIGVVSGSGTGLLMGRLYAYNQKTFEWNAFRLANLEWWETNGNGAAINDALTKAVDKLYKNPSEHRIPVLFSSGKLMETSGLDNLQEHFYFPGLLPKPGGYISEVQTRPYPVDSIHKLGYDPIIAFDLISDVLRSPKFDAITAETHTMLSTVESLSKEERHHAQVVKEAQLGLFPLKATFKTRYGDLKAIGYRDAVVIFRSMHFSCQ